MLCALYELYCCVSWQTYALQASQLLYPFRVLSQVDGLHGGRRGKFVTMRRHHGSLCKQKKPWGLGVTDLWNCSSAGAVTQESSLHQGCGALPCPVLLLPASVAEYQEGLHLLLLAGLSSHAACTLEEGDVEAAAEAVGEAAESRVLSGPAGACPNWSC